MKRPDSEAAELVTADEIAAMLCVAKSWVYREAREGRMPSVRLGRYVRFRPERVRAWLDGLEAESVDGPSGVGVAGR